MNLPPNRSAIEDRSKDLLRFITCGSVDDGKSTLIGRLLYDSHLICDDQLEVLAQDSTSYGTTGEDLDFALLMDGLEAEREQGITIDVAYRFFSTPQRSFIVGDTPGHEQFTRNMATAASAADLAVILVDARKGLMIQTRRHSLICSLLGVRHVVIAINKIDLVQYQQDVYDRFVGDYYEFAEPLGFDSIVAVPISARFGDNVTTLSRKTQWYRGPALLHYLETIQINDDTVAKPFRFPVQWVNRPNLDFRGYAGTVASGLISTHDEIVEAVSGRSAKVAQILGPDGPVATAEAGDAILISLSDEIDIGRGDILVRRASLPEVADQFAAHVIWMSDDPLVPGRSYLGRFGTRTVPLTVTRIKHRIDVNTREQLATPTLALNDIAFCNLSTPYLVAFDPYEKIRETGAFIIIDRFTNHTVGAGMIDFALRRATNIHWQPLLVGKAERSALSKQRPVIIWFTGLSGAGKSTIATMVEQLLHARGHHTTLLDGDNIRHGLNRDLGFTEADRVENIRRVGEVAKLMVEGGLIVLCAFISPYRADREMVRKLVEPDEFIEVFVDTPIEVCIDRDPKGLYAKARKGQIMNFTGIDAPYQRPDRPEIHLHTIDESPRHLAESVLQNLIERNIIPKEH